MNERVFNKLESLQTSIGYYYNNIEYLKLALTHSSYANEKGHDKSNERLEFLGDSILGFIIGRELFVLYPSMSEGDMTKLRSLIVCERSLARCSKEKNIGDYIILGKGEEITGGRRRNSILADAWESIIGSIYMDSGIEEAEKFILNNMSSVLEDAKAGKLFSDYKTKLQEELQKMGKVTIEYRIVDEKGPDHNKLFTAEVLLNGKTLGKGNGSNKKEAEQNAAENALDNRGVD